jgi:hypothetical protein
LTLRSLENSDKQQVLSGTGIVGFESNAAAVALQAGESAEAALDLLELGRGVLPALFMEMRADVTSLKIKHPKLAKEFVSLRDELAVKDGTRAYDASKEFDCVVEKIRTKRDFEEFPLPPRPQAVLDAACLGLIVVMNASKYRCDAILIQRDQVRALRLKHLKYHDVKKRNTSEDFKYLDTLEWLWDAIASPVVHELGFRDPLHQN